MKRSIWFASALALLLATASAAPAQKIDLKLDALAARASEKAELDLDPNTLGKLLEGGKLPGIAPASAKEVRIRNYKFGREGEYTEKDLEPLRKQLAEGSGWTRSVQVRKKTESVELYLYKDSDQIQAFVLIVCEPQEVSAVYVAGEMTAEQLKSLVSSKIRYAELP